MGFLRRAGVTLVITVTVALFAAVAGCAPPVVPSSSASRPISPAQVVASPTEPGPVPWIDRPGSLAGPSPLPASPLPTAGRPCGAADVRATYEGGNGAAGSVFHLVSFTNIGSDTCVLRGTPRVVATESRKQPVTAIPAKMFDVVPAALSPGGKSQLELQTMRDCEARDRNPGTWPTAVYDSLQISMPSGGAVTVRGTFDVECGLYVGEFGVTPPDPVYPTPPLAGADIRLELPASVRAGGQLRYVVDVANPTDADMVLDPCPSYVQGLGSAGKTPLLLNCDAVHDIAAGKTVRFAMEIPVPVDTPTGPTEVWWNVIDITSGKDGASGSVEVVGADTPCTSAQLTAAITGPGSVPGPPNMYGLKGVATDVPLTLTNRSSSACSVRGAPKVSISDAHGAALNLTTVDQGPIELGPVPVTPTLVVLAPGASATTHLYWYLPWCAPDPNPVTVTITLPANGATAAAAPTAGWNPPACKDWGGPKVGGQTSADPLQPS